MKIRSVFVVVCSLHFLGIFFIVQSNVLSPVRPSKQEIVQQKVMVRTVSLSEEHIVAMPPEKQLNSVQDIPPQVIPREEPSVAEAAPDSGVVPQVNEVDHQSETFPEQKVSEIFSEPRKDHVQDLPQEEERATQEPVKQEPNPQQKKTAQAPKKQTEKKQVVKKQIVKKQVVKKQIVKKQVVKQQPEKKKETPPKNPKSDSSVKKTMPSQATPSSSPKQTSTTKTTSSTAAKAAVTKEEETRRAAALQELLSSLDSVKKEGQGGIRSQGLGSQETAVSSMRQQKGVVALQSEAVVMADSASEWKTPEEKSYYDELVSRLQLDLRLPEYGHVKVKLTLSSKGGFQKLVVTEAKSQKNRAYVQERLPGMRFPPFGKSFPGEAEHTFLLNLSNSMRY